MKRYAVKRNNTDKTVAILNDEEKSKSYTIDILEGITEKEDISPETRGR